MKKFEKIAIMAILTLLALVSCVPQPTESTATETVIDTYIPGVEIHLPEETLSESVQAEDDVWLPDEPHFVIRDGELVLVDEWEMRQEAYSLAEERALEKAAASPEEVVEVVETVYGLTYSFIIANGEVLEVYELGD